MSKPQTVCSSNRAPRWLTTLVLLLVASSTATADEDVVKSVMDYDPPAVLAVVEKTFPKRLAPLWVEALKQPDTDLQRQAAETMARATRGGMKGLEIAVEPLIRTMTADDQHPVVQLACARALIELNAQQAAPTLLELTRDSGLDMAVLVEPALGRWKFAGIRNHWLTRLNEPQASSRRLKLAIRGLGTMGDAKAIDQLLKIIRSKKSRSDVRLAAARAASGLPEVGLEKEAAALLSDGKGTLVDRLIVVELLTRQKGDETVKVLSQLVTDSSPSVVSRALDRLSVLSPEKAIEASDRILTSPETKDLRRDAKLRQSAIRTLALRKNPATVQTLSRMLNDMHPHARILAREKLLELTKVSQELDTAVRVTATRELGRDFWRAQEQAILLLVAINHEPIAGRLVQLLDVR